MSFLFVFVITLLVLVADLFIVGVCVQALLLPLLLCKVIMGSEAIYRTLEEETLFKKVIVELLFDMKLPNIIT